ncbi:MAG: D-glycero-beta-D-manno-heptose 1-phosphate adenylyltransferase [Planctomycetes bacterium]|nr:D-glycero-beta-D-manno-heptose 1-phosphate adenylyltransferase [Planctomycetota bacterium]
MPISKKDIADELRRLIGIRGSKLIDRDALKKEVERRRRFGQSIVFTNGCFDLLHAGHIYYLREAREQGACLIVAINSDESVKRLKGPNRPIVSEKERAAMLAALECVDYVTIFEEDTADNLLDLLRPDLFVKGGSTEVVVERDMVEGYGGQVVTLGLVDGLSTTKIIDRILSTYNGG